MNLEKIKNLIKINHLLKWNLITPILMFFSFEFGFVYLLLTLLFSLYRKNKYHSKTLDIRKAICPHCYKSLKKIPGAKTRCHHCNNFMYVKTDTNNIRSVITKKQKEKIDKKFRILNGTQEEYVKHQREHNKTKEKLQKHNSKEPSENDIRWSILNKNLQKHMKDNDWKEMESIYFEQARILYEEGKDHNHLLKLANKCVLMNYKKDEVVKGVEVLSSGDSSCNECKKINGKVFTIEEALKRMPLPVENCLHKPNKSQGWCTCVYAPTI